MGGTIRPVRPNVVLVVLDTARADAFEPYGAPRGASPAVAQLAADGHAFEHAFSPANWTVPSHASLFTGLLPRALGLAQAPGGSAAGVKQVMQSSRDILLPTVLQRQGYDTHGISANLWISPQSGFDTGFEAFEYVTGDRHGLAPGGDTRSRVAWDLSALRATADAGADAAERAVREWVHARSDRPFFLFVNLIECHSPYLPPKPYNDLGPLQRLMAGQASRKYLSLENIWRASLGSLDVPAGAVERMKHLYARGIKLMDDWLARMREMLDSIGISDETIVMLVSDHGEHFNERGMLGHCFSLDDSLIRVPVVAAGPGVTANGAAMSLTDIPRMVGGWVGIDDAPWNDYPVTPGVAVAEMDAAGSADHPTVIEAIEKWQLDAEGIRLLMANAACATDGRYKVVRTDGVDALYDLEADPGETVPVDAPVPENLRRALDTAAGYEAEITVPVAEPYADDGYTEEEAAGMADQLRQLGYL